MPLEPPPTGWRFPSRPSVDEHGLVAVGADLEPGTLLAAYRAGLFPMPVGPDASMGWWSPDPRGVLPIDRLHISRSLHRSRRRYEVRVDTAFADVVSACADPSRDGGWITEEIRAAYLRLHDLGWTHSVEAWDEQGLAGGLYGVAIGGFFAGESMFHRRTDASKVALAALADLLHPGGLLDVQWVTPHLASLGAVAIPGDEYADRLAAALELPLPVAFDEAAP